MISEFYLSFFNLYIRIWFVALGVRWLVSLLPEQIFRFFRVSGLIVRFPIKRFFYWVYGVPVKEIDFNRGVMKTKDTKNFDCLVTTNIILPLAIMSYIAGWLLYLGNTLYFEGFRWLGGSTYVVGLAVACFTLPDLEELKLFSNINVLSLYSYILKLGVISGISYVVFLYTAINADLLIIIAVILLATPIYRYHSEEQQAESIAEEKSLVLKSDPFA
ncbi:MAG: hypothetical protein ACTSQE_11580 [Candidatus Heimdallarchaeaceae archaeon]